MVELKPLLSLEELKTTFLSEVAANKHERMLYIKYDDELDVLKVLLVPKGEEYSVFFLDDHLALLYQPGTREIIGLMVEDFESIFLQRYPRIKEIWEQTKNFQAIEQVAYVTKDIIGAPGVELTAALT